MLTNYSNSSVIPNYVLIMFMHYNSASVKA